MTIINEAPPAWLWEGWVLGDLPGLLREASDVIGVGTEVDKVEIVPPTGSFDRPEIRLSLSARGDALRPLLERLVDDCYLPGTPDEQARRWEAELPGLRVVLLANAREIQ